MAIRATVDVPQRIPLTGVREHFRAQFGSALVTSGIMKVGTLSVSFYPCSNCGQRAVGKLASVYANWFEGENKRKAYRQRLCVGCLTDLMGSLKAGASADSSILTACPMCGMDASQTLDGIFLTIYPPKQPEREYALTTCGSCATKLRECLVANADELGDRSVGAAAPTTSPNAGWTEVPW